MFFNFYRFCFPRHQFHTHSLSLSLFYNKICSTINFHRYLLKKESQGKVGLGWVGYFHIWDFFGLMVLGKIMAVELMMGYGGDSFAGKSEENALAVKEAASAGIQSVEKLMRLISQEQQYQETATDNNNNSSKAASMELGAVADVAVDKFKRVISLLDRKRIGHARFRRAPVGVNPPQQTQQNQAQEPGTSNVSEPHRQKTEPVSAFKAYCPTPTPIARLPPLPNTHQQLLSLPIHPQSLALMVTKNGALDRKDAATNINFCSSPPISAGNSFVSSLTGDTESLQPSLSSGFQITNLSQVSSVGKPPLSSSSLKRRCNSMDDAAIKCGSSSGRCHCSKKRLVFFFFITINPKYDVGFSFTTSNYVWSDYSNCFFFFSRKSKIKRMIRVPAISPKMADIPPDEYSWRKYGQKPIKGSPHPRCVSVLYTLQLLLVSLPRFL